MKQRSTDPITMARVLRHLTEKPGEPAMAPRAIGWLSRFGDNLRVSFDENYIGDAARPVLSQLYCGETDVQTRQILSAIDDERLINNKGRLPAYFSNLLPEGFNRERLAAQRGVGIDDELELLAAAGHDLSGAVEIVPGHDVPGEVLALHATRHLEPVEPSAVAAPLADGFSVDGIQTKFSMVHAGRHYTVRRGTEAGEFIAKLPSIQYPDLVHNEAVCYRLAAACGVNVARAALVPVNELAVPQQVKASFTDALMVERFDRFKRADGTTGRVHFEELAQALGEAPRHKYRHIEPAMVALLTVLKQASETPRDRDDVFRRWTVFALMGNTDAHLKNWGFVYRDNLSAALAPAYDMVCVTAYFDDKAPHELSQNRKFDETLRNWNEDAAETLAKRAGLLDFNRCRNIVRQTRRKAVAEWPAILEDAPPRVRATILERLKQLA